MFNLMKTAILMAAITALFMAIGSLMGGQTGMMLALAVAVAMNFFSYWFSDKMVLKMYNAREVDATSAPQFYRMVQDLAQRAGASAEDLKQSLRQIGRSSIRATHTVNQLLALARAALAASERLSLSSPPEP